MEYIWWLLDNPIRLCYYHLRAVHANSIAVGLFRPRHLLEPLDSDILRHCSRKYVSHEQARPITDHREAFSAIVDLYLAIYPAIVLYKLQINFKKKVVLSVALGLGSM